MSSSLLVLSVEISYWKYFREFIREDEKFDIDTLHLVRICGNLYVSFTKAQNNFVLVFIFDLSLEIPPSFEELCQSVWRKENFVALASLVLNNFSKNYIVDSIYIAMECEHSLVKVMRRKY